jgi:uncharacterized UBP type Zn finger protein
MQPLTEFLEWDDFSSILSLNEANKHGSGGKVLRAFGDLMIQVAESKTAMNPEKFKSVMGRFMPGFNDCNQHDAFEFLL